MRILALVPGGISEQILFFPTLATLKAQYPQAVIDVIVEPRAKSAYRICPHVNEVLAFDYRDRNGLADFLNLLGIIRDREYEAAISGARRLSYYCGSMAFPSGLVTKMQAVISCRRLFPLSPISMSPFCTMI
jgi:ADP-heptose:LPS heptosyltransferase